MGVRCRRMYLKANDVFVKLREENMDRYVKLTDQPGSNSFGTGDQVAGIGVVRLF